MSNKRKTGMTTSQSQTSLESAASKKANTCHTISTESTMNESLPGEVRKLIELVRQLKADYKEVYEKYIKTQDTLDLTIERMDKLQKDFNDYKKINDPDALSARIDTISTKNANLKTSTAESAAKSSLLQSPWSSFKFKPVAIDSQNTQIVCDLHNAVAEEQSERESRESNLLIFGLPECESSSEEERQEKSKLSANEVLTVLGVDMNKIKSYHRFRKSNSSKPSIIKLQLQNPSDRFTIIKKAKELRLKGESYSKVFINFDLTFAQRNLRRQLVTDFKEKNRTNSSTDKIYVIRDNAIKLITKKDK